MTDWERIVEEIHRAMEALDDAHAVSETLREKPSSETMDAFKTELNALYHELGTIKYIWEHEFDFSFDELGNILSQMSTGKKPPSDHSARFEH